MKRLPLSIAGAVVAALLPAAGDEKPLPPPVLPATPGAPAQSSGSTVIELSAQTLTFKPTRDDMTVGKVIFSIYCARPDDVRINGVRPDPAWSDVHFKDKEIVVDSRIPATAARDHAWLYIDLPEVAKNQFTLAPLKIEVAGSEPRGMICMSIKVWFKEVTNQYDSMFYEKTDDRYALVSFCTSQPEKSEVKSRFQQNRVATTGEFKDALTKPFVIKLNQRALRKEWAK